jgi:DNA invertase Pin-like site-specific DNA recombinase
VSVESQVKAGLQWCEENGVTVVAVLRDNSMSASLYATMQRPDYAEALRLLSTRQANLLWTWESSRAQRELDVFVQLRRLLIDVQGFWAYDDRIWDMNNPDDRISTAEDAVEAEKESDRLRKRILRGTNTRALDGLWHGPKTWGLRKVWDQRTGECIALEKDENEAPAAVEMCTRMLAGEAETVIAEDFNERGILPPRANKWLTCHVVKVHELSMDPVGWAELTRTLSEEQLESACRIVTMMGAMENPRNIVRVLNREDAAHVFPGRWTGRKVHAAVLNPTLAGLKVHRGKIIGEGQCPRSSSLKTITRWWPSWVIRCARRLRTVPVSSIC